MCAYRGLAVKRGAAGCGRKALSLGRLARYLRGMASDILICGAGPVGLAMALALARHDMPSTVIDRFDPARASDGPGDARVSALGAASWLMLEALGAADLLDGKAAPMAAVEVRDGKNGAPLDFTPGERDGPLGRVVPNRDLNAALFDLAKDDPAIELVTGSEIVARRFGEFRAEADLADGRTLAGALLVGADGRMSPTRRALGIATTQWDYGQQALNFMVSHERPHGGVARQVFDPAGPLALLPLPDMDGAHRSAVVWTVPEAEAKGYAALSGRALVAAMADRCGSPLGAMELVAPAVLHPLGYHHSQRVAGARAALIGDAAHGIHPMAGQGLNLGLRDAAALAEVLVEGARKGLDLGDPHLLARYDQWRALDNTMMSAMTDGLQKLYGLRGGLARAVRRAGMAAVGMLPPVKALVMDEARGEAGEMPRLLQGLTV